MTSNSEVLILVEIESVIDQQERQAYQSAARQQLKARRGKVLGAGAGPSRATGRTVLFWCSYGRRKPPSGIGKRARPTDRCWSNANGLPTE